MSCRVCATEPGASSDLTVTTPVYAPAHCSSTQLEASIPALDVYTILTMVSPGSNKPDGPRDDHVGTDVGRQRPVDSEHFREFLI